MKLFPLSIIFSLGSQSSLSAATSTTIISPSLRSTDSNKKNDLPQESSFNLKQEIEPASQGLDFMNKVNDIITSISTTKTDVINYGMRNLRIGARFRGSLRKKHAKDILEEFYNVTGGSGWDNSTGWLDDEVDVCEWYGVECNNWNVVTGLHLRDNELNGTIPDVVNKLYSLQHLDLAKNDLTGTIPSELRRLYRLKYLDLARNDLTGRIPSELGRFYHLKTLNLTKNDLTGSIPSELKSLFKLEILNLSDNKLTGSLPSELAFLVNLEELYLEENDLTGDIPNEICLLHGAWILENMTTSNITDSTTISGVCDVIFDESSNTTGVSFLNGVCSLLTSIVDISPSLEVLSGDCGTCTCCTDRGTPCCYDGGDQECSSSPFVL